MNASSLVPTAKVIFLAAAGATFFCAFWTCREPGYDSAGSLTAALVTMLASMKDAVSVPVAEQLKKYHFYREKVTLFKLPEIYPAFVTAFGQQIASRKEIAAWLRKNDDIIWRVYRCASSVDTHEATAVGFFEVVPLTPEAAGKVQRNALDGRSFTPHDIASQRESPGHLYIASIGYLKNNLLARAGTELKLISFVEEAVAGKSVVLYARPVSPDGLRLLKRREFEKVDPLRGDFDTIWRRALSQGAKLIS